MYTKIKATKSTSPIIINKINFCNGILSKIKVFKITSDEFFANNDKKFNLIYIDGCHEPEFISRDLENGFECLEENPS